MTDQVREAFAILRNQNVPVEGIRAAVEIVKHEIERLTNVVENGCMKQGDDGEAVDMCPLRAENARLTEENRRLLIVDRERCIHCGELGEDEPCPVLADEIKAHEQSKKKLSDANEALTAAYMIGENRASERLKSALSEAHAAIETLREELAEAERQNMLNCASFEDELARVRKAVFWAKQNADRCIQKVDCCTITLNTTCGSPECIDLIVAAANREE